MKLIYWDFIDAKKLKSSNEIVAGVAGVLIKHNAEKLVLKDKFGAITIDEKILSSLDKLIFPVWFPDVIFD